MNDSQTLSAVILGFSTIFLVVDNYKSIKGFFSNYESKKGDTPSFDNFNELKSRDLISYAGFERDPFFSDMKKEDFNHPIYK